MKKRAKIKMGEYFLKNTQKVSISYRTDGRLVQDNVTRSKMPDGFCWPTINTSDGYSSTSSGIKAVILASIDRFFNRYYSFIGSFKKIFGLRFLLYIRVREAYYGRSFGHSNALAR